MGTIKFHEAIHGFRMEQGTGTAIMNVKLMMQLAKRDSDPLYMIFLDVRKAYDTLDRDRTTKVLKEYGVGDKVRRIIELVWKGDTMTPKQNKYYGKSFKAERGVRQGDIISPTIFNIVIDAIIRDCEEKMKDKGILTIQFYADDGFIGGKDHKVVQSALTLFEENFLKFGLLMNVEKTESMILIGSKPVHSISKDAYRKMITGIGESFKDNQNMTINCELCNMSIKMMSKKRDQLSAKCKKGRQNTIATNPDLESYCQPVNYELEKSNIVSMSV
jgi:hypothetical protein